MGAILIDPDNPETQEKVKWEQHHTAITAGSAGPGNPYRYRAFPKMLYLARQIPPSFPGAGKFACALSYPSPWGFQNGTDGYQRMCDAVDGFNAACRRTVHNEAEMEQALSTGEGWRENPREAIGFQEDLARMVSDEAAHRAWLDRNMSDKAQEEAAKHDASAWGHQAEVPTEKKRRQMSEEHKAKLAAGRARAKAAKESAPASA